MQKLRRNISGFTIIEVLIVLAIAGLIMLIVFLAVPALQRNSRNTQRRDDVSKALSAVIEWSNNHNGGMPSGATEQGEALANANLGIYDGQVSWGNSHPADENALVISVNHRCNGEGAVTQQNRSVAALYQVETGGDPTDQCEES